MATKYAVETDASELTELLPGDMDPTDPWRFTLTTDQGQAAEMAMNRDPAVVSYTELTEEPEVPETPYCTAGKHHVENGKTVNAKGWCNLCLKDAQRRKPAGTTAAARRLLS